MKLSQQGCTKKTKAEELSNHLIGCHSLLEYLPPYLMHSSIMALLFLSFLDFASTHQHLTDLRSIPSIQDFRLSRMKRAVSLSSPDILSLAWAFMSCSWSPIREASTVAGLRLQLLALARFRTCKYVCKTVLILQTTVMVRLKRKQVYRLHFVQVDLFR